MDMAQKLGFKGKLADEVRTRSLIYPCTEAFLLGRRSNHEVVQALLEVRLHPDR